MKGEDKQEYEGEYEAESQNGSKRECKKESVVHQRILIFCNKQDIRSVVNCITERERK